MVKRILYVEDDADIRSVAEIALEGIGGFEVRACESGQEALEAAHDFCPDLLLLDVMMPEMDGSATLEALWENPRHAKIPAIFMTAKVYPAEIARYMALGAIGVIPKPFDVMDLPNQIRQIFAGNA